MDVTIFCRSVHHVWLTKAENITDRVIYRTLSLACHSWDILDAFSTWCAKNLPTRLYPIMCIRQEDMHAGPAHMSTCPNIRCNVGVWRGDAGCWPEQLRVLVHRQGAAQECWATHRGRKMAKKDSSVSSKVCSAHNLRPLGLGRERKRRLPHGAAR